MINKANYQQDLWPDDIQTVTIVSPKTIVEEQGIILGKKTNNIIVGKVKLDEYQSKRSPKFFYTFSLYCSPLDYRYQLFQFNFQFDYPVSIEPDSAILEESFPENNSSKSFDLTANTEEEFIEILRKIFAAQKTRKVIAGILSQVQPIKN